ncbi:hypothetical protein FOA52_006012 [Chlamydomonas sp. UWO 241]|nr:hypothetical protein FOA52_006012 [Chlamydomonas sp. UWO 241]
MSVPTPELIVMLSTASAPPDDASSVVIRPASSPASGAQPPPPSLLGKAAPQLCRPSPFTGSVGMWDAGADGAPASGTEQGPQQQQQQQQGTLQRQQQQLEALASQGQPQLQQGLQGQQRGQQQQEPLQQQGPQQQQWQQPQLQQQRQQQQGPQRQQQQGQQQQGPEVPSRSLSFRRPLSSSTTQPDTPPCSSGEGSTGRPLGSPVANAQQAAQQGAQTQQAAQQGVQQAQQGQQAQQQQQHTSQMQHYVAQPILRQVAEGAPDDVGMAGMLDTAGDVDASHHRSGECREAQQAEGSHRVHAKERTVGLLSGLFGRFGSAGAGTSGTGGPTHERQGSPADGLGVPPLEGGPPRSDGSGRDSRPRARFPPSEHSGAQSIPRAGSMGTLRDGLDADSVEDASFLIRSSLRNSIRLEGLASSLTSTSKGATNILQQSIVASTAQHTNFSSVGGGAVTGDDDRATGASVPTPRLPARRESTRVAFLDITLRPMIDVPVDAGWQSHATLDLHKILQTAPSGDRGNGPVELMPSVHGSAPGHGDTVTSNGGAAAGRHGASIASATATATALHHLTGLTGSLLYMAPEVFKGLPYNQKADVFSFGICLYEMVHRTLLLLTILQKETAKNPRATFADKEAAIMEYVQAVAAGYRPPLSRNLPPELAELLRRCWSSNPLERPSMHSVHDTLHELSKNPEALELLDIDPNATACCVVS